MESLATISVLASLLGRLSANYSENITFTSGRYDRAQGFFLYVGVEGDVNIEDMSGRAQTRHFVVGYHPLKIRAVLESGTVATDLAACFN